jgi:hypothetical protein
VIEILARLAWHVFRNSKRKLRFILAHEKCAMRGEKEGSTQLDSRLSSEPPGEGMAQGPRRTTAVIKCKKRLAFYFALAGCLLAGCCQGGAADGVGDDLGNELLHIH